MKGAEPDHFDHRFGGGTCGALLRQRASLALVDAHALCRRAHRAQHDAFLTYSRSGGLSFARVRGEFRGAPVMATIRGDGRVVLGEPRQLRAWLNEALGVANPRQTGSWDPADNDPLWRTVTIAQACDQVTGVDFYRTSPPAAIARGGDTFLVDDRAPGLFGADVSDIGQVHVVRLYGELDLSAAQGARDTVVGAAGSTVMVDLAGLSFIDARGLSALIEAKKSITEAGHTCVLYGARGIVRRVFEIAGLASSLLDC